MYEYREGQGIFNIELDQEVTEFGTYECTDGTYTISPDGVRKVISDKTGATALVLPYQSWIDDHQFIEEPNYNSEEMQQQFQELQVSMLEDKVDELEQLLKDGGVI